MSHTKKSFWAFILPAALLKIGVVLYTLAFLLNSIPALADSKLTKTLFSIGVPVLFWGVVLGIPLGLLAKHFSKKARQTGGSDEQTAFTQSVGWAAFFSPFVWALTNKLYSYLLPSLIPVYNLYLGGRLALQGRAQSWKSGKWSDFEMFKKKQKSLPWKITLVFLLIFFIGLVIAVIFSAVAVAQGTAQGFSVIFKALFIILTNWRH